MATITSRSPITGEVVATAQAMGSADVDAELALARAAQLDWAQVPILDRAARLQEVRRELAHRAEEVVDAIHHEMGKAEVDAAMEIGNALMILDWVRKFAPKVLANRSLKTAPMIHKRAWVEHVPLGVVAVITPWNFPLAIPFQSIPQALVAGNAVLFKPSEMTLRTGQLIAECFASCGTDLVRVITGLGDTGDALSRSSVDKIIFTGSGRVGRMVAIAAAERHTPVVLELGGKDPMIVTDGADARAAARAAIGGGFANTGQTCIAVERIIATPGIYDAVVRELAAAAPSAGPGPDKLVGTLSTGSQLATLVTRIQGGLTDGARVVYGGRARPDLPGHVLEPTVLADVDPSSEIYTEESFGPILSVVRARSVDHAVELANSHELSLTASVFAGSREEGRAIASRLRAGGVSIGDALVGSAMAGAPFGGVGGSGHGRLGGPEGLLEMTSTRVISEDRFRGVPPTMSLTLGRRPKTRTVLRLLRLFYGRGR